MVLRVYKSKSDGTIYYSDYTTSRKINYGYSKMGNEPNYQIETLVLMTNDVFSKVVEQAKSVF